LTDIAFGSFSHGVPLVSRYILILPQIGKNSKSS
jgi:hypothetical protein